MGLMLGGGGVVLVGLALLMAMVVGALPPAFGLALAAYASAFAGMLLGLLGAVRIARRRPGRGSPPSVGT